MLGLLVHFQRSYYTHIVKKVYQEGVKSFVKVTQPVNISIK